MNATYPPPGAERHPSQFTRLTDAEISRRYGLIASVVGHREPTAETWATLRRIVAGATDEELIGAVDQ
jgi:hypothetical protein